MIIKNGKTITSVYKGNRVIDKIYKGTLLVYEGWKNLIASGVPPLTLNKCKGVDLLDYKLYGNSVQDGTPTPDTPIEVESVGDYDEETGKYKIPVKVSGKNLFDGVLLKKALNLNTGEIGANNASRVCSESLINVQENSNITISWKNADGYVNPTSIFIVEYDSSGAFIQNQSANLKLTIFNHTFKLSENAKYIRFQFYRSGNMSIESVFNIQVEVGPTSTNFEPYVEPITTNIYLKEPLRKIDDFADYIDFENKKVVRKIYREFIDTVEYVSGDVTTYKKFLSDITHKPYITYTTPNHTPSTVGYAISNKFKRNTDSYTNQGNRKNVIQTYITKANVNRISYTFDDSSINTIDKAQEKIGNGFYVYYVLATPIEEEIELPNIPTLKGTTILEVDTTIQPSNMEVTYKGKN